MFFFFRGSRVSLFLLLIIASFAALPPPVCGQHGGQHGGETRYFEAPLRLTPEHARFPRLIDGGDRLLVLYQEVERDGPEGGRIHITSRESTTGRSWSEPRRVIGPIVFTGTTVPLLYSAVVHSSGAVYVAVTASSDETWIFRSEDRGRTFSRIHMVVTEETNVAPMLAESSDGALLLFVNRNLDGRQQVIFQVSPDGRQWSDSQPLDPNPDTGLSFLPRHATDGVRDFVVFQALSIRLRSTYQLYSVTSDDGGRTWSASQRLTTFVDVSQTDNPDLYDNQRPDIAIDPREGTPRIVWERRFQTGSPQIYFMHLSGDGSPTEEVEEVTGRFDIARAPRIAFDHESPVILWFTNPSGNSRIFLGRPGRFRWEGERLSPAVGEAVFAEALYFNNLLHIVWQVRVDDQNSAVVYLEPDQFTAPPTLAAGNFQEGRRSASTVARVVVRDPPDASGIAGYAYTWSRDPQAEVPRELMQAVPNREIQVSATEDGPWYLRVRAQDFAGNWSDPETIRFVLDTTPPGPVVFPPPRVDEDGYLVSNTFQVGWQPPPDEDDLGGYSVRLDYLGPATDLEDRPIPTLPVAQRITTTGETLSRTNIADGLWLLTVAAVDAVGNVGAARSLPLRLNKFVPFTSVTGATVRRDMLGRPEVGVVGRGFDTNGTIQQIVLDRDGSEPWDYTFTLRNGDFRVVNDGMIDDLRVEDIEPGVYRLGLVHPERGLYIASQPLRFEPRGAIKYGDFSPVYRPGYEVVRRAVTRRSTPDIVYILVVAAALLLIVISSVRLVVIGGEIRRLHGEAYALVTGREKESRKTMREEAARMKIKGFGLRLKFAFFVVLLVVSVVVVVAVTLSRTVLERQEEILVTGLQERIELLLEGQVTGARPALENPALNIDQLQTLTEQGGAMRESLFVTITALGSDGDVETVFATRDRRILDGEEDGLIDTEEYLVGATRLQDTITPRVRQLAEELNRQAREELGRVPEELEELSRQAQTLILQGAPDEELALIDQVRGELLQRSRVRLLELAGPIRSEPSFDFTELQRDIREFVFFRPVLDIPPGADASFTDYYRGTIRVGVSTQILLDEIDSTTADLIRTTIMVAVAAVALGILGAYLLATIIVIPIRRLVSLVELIAATEDKSTLKGTSLTLRSKDELNLLASSINSMTAGLVKAAEADKDLLFGKETQKAFIPLERISDDAKRSYGAMTVPGADFFGYYEGAKGVSGDYFAYQKLSDRYFAMIKCDVAGKGIPAALIMVQVATVFQDYFRGWTVKRPGFDLSSFILRVNDVVAEQQFKGRFAALTVGILDVRTGDFHLSNAGDNQLHLYRESLKKVEQLTIPGGPASGMFSSQDMPITFPQETRKVTAGDVLLLFTDGLEEAKRLLRGPNFEPITVTREMIEAGSVPDFFQEGQDGEEFSNERIHEIIRAVQNRERYRLEKVLNPDSDEVIEFDYSECEEGPRDLSLAVIAAERMFRIYRGPGATGTSRIRVDIIVDDFLRKHLVNFSSYFSHPLEEPQGEGDDGGAARPVLYRQYSHLREDEQYDDLTMLAVRKT